MLKTWLITGSSRGLGRAIAQAALERGDQVVATARDPKAVADLVEAHPGRAIGVALDVTDPDQAVAAVKSATDAFGRLDVVVNNAGYANMGSLEETPLDDFRAQIETNLWGVIHVTRAALPVLRAQHSGHFVQISTVGGRRGVPGVGPYSTAKHGVEGFSESLFDEVAPLGLRVTIVEPSGFRTDWAGSSMSINEPGPDYEGTVGQMIRLNRDHTPVGDPAKAAAAILRIVDEPEPPLRLALGNDAVDMIRAADEAKLAEIDRWEELGRSADFEDAERHDLSILERS
jgi:NAD(P)-dependent dehydrogenase (short-subunit alcohol dehydrogenase family)